MAIGFMSFGGMLTGGDEETPSLDNDPENIGINVEEKIDVETTVNTVSVSEIK